MKFQAVVLVVGVAMLLFGFAHSGEQARGKSQAEKLFARATADDYMGSEVAMPRSPRDSSHPPLPP